MKHLAIAAVVVFAMSAFAEQAQANRRVVRHPAKSRAAQLHRNRIRPPVRRIVPPRYSYRAPVYRSFRGNGYYRHHHLYPRYGAMGFHGAYGPYGYYGFGI